MAARKLKRAVRRRAVTGRSARKRGAVSSRAKGRRPTPRRKARATAARRKVVRRSKPAKAAATSRARPKRKASAPLASPAAAKNAIGFLSQHVDFTSHALDEVKRFYTELLGFSQFEFDSQMSYLMVSTGATSSVGFMPPMPGPPENWRPPREPNLYLMVADVDRAHRELVSRGVAFESPPQDMPWGHRVAVTRDPEGRTVCLAQIVRTR